MRGIIYFFVLIASTQAFLRVKWMDPTAYSHRPYGEKIVNPRMINGRPALEGEAPYMAGIVVDHSRFCGGALISSTVVLTSASCIEGMSEWEVHLGTLNLVGAQTESEDRQVLTSSIARAHDKFDILENANAVAVIKLPTAVTVSKNVKPIRLPSRSQQQMDFTGSIAVTSGWGISMKGEANQSPFLKVANVTVISNPECQKIYGEDRVLDTMFCVDTRQQSIAACFGDSGSPIALVDADGEKTLIGVSLWGSLQDCSSRFPALATKIHSYLEWISTNGGPSIRP